MYGKNNVWKFQIEIDGEVITYTGKVLDEDAVSLRVKTLRDEDLILSKSKIVQAMIVEVKND